MLFSQSVFFRSSIFIGILFSQSGLAFAGAWLREKNEIYSKIAYSQFESDKIFAAKGNKKLAGPEFTDQTVSLYGEYGFSSDWTGILSVDFKSLDYEAAELDSTESGLADAWLYIKRSVLRAPFVMSAQFGGKLPLGYDEKHIPPLGQGQIDLEARLLVGKSLHPFPAYGNAEIGYRKRNGDFSDEIPFRIETGFHLGKAVLFKLSLHGVSNRSSDKASTLGATNRIANVFDQEYMKLGPGLIFFLKKGFSIDLYYEEVISGGNTAAGRSLGLGLAWQGALKGSREPK